MVIDSHHHFWKYDPTEYDWIDDSMDLIRSDFLPGKLEQTIQDAGVGGVISVQARQSLTETDWLLEMAHHHSFIKGVVGWLPLCDKEVEQLLRRYSNEKYLKGVRHVIQGEPDPEFILRSDFNNGVSLLKNFCIVYDILVIERQLPNTISFVDRHEEQVFVLDHIAKPLIKEHALSPWMENIKALAKRQNVHCKISGMVTEADFNYWTSDQLRPYFEVILEAFGADRLLFGSDWPVCLVATTYQRWLELVRESISAFSASEQALIMGGNASRIYNLEK